MFPDSSCFGPSGSFIVSRLAPFLGRGLEFSEVIPEASGFKIVTLNDTLALRKIAHPLEAATAIKLGRPKGKWTLGEIRDGENRTQWWPSQVYSLSFLVLVSTSLRACAPHFSLAETGMRSQVQSICSASLPGAGETLQ